MATLEMLWFKIFQSASKKEDFDREPSRLCEVVLS